MPTKRQQQLIDALAAHGNSTAAAKALGISASTLRGGLSRLRKRGLVVEPTLHVEPAPPVDEPLEELLARKRAHVERALKHEDWAKLIPVRVRDDRPIGLLIVGDPHLDDDYCDIQQIQTDLTTVGRTEGFYAGHLGDATNNWVGRLKALYANQSTRFNDGLRLAQWMFDLCPNLFVVGGNHDRWEKGMDLLRFIVRQNEILQPHGVRMALNFPSGLQLRIHARHDFPGKSQYSDTHGMKREILFGHRDDILVAGHTHVDEARIEPSIDGQVHHFYRVSGYKIIDDFAKENGFRPKRMGAAVTLVINPASRVRADIVKPFWDTEAAADFLTYLRNRKC